MGATTSQNSDKSIDSGCRSQPFMACTWNSDIVEYKSWVQWEESSNRKWRIYYYFSTADVHIVYLASHNNIVFIQYQLGSVLAIYFIYIELTGKL